jgi:two-component system sensor histidine kinase HydH
MKDTMRDADVVYLEIRQGDYWRRRRLSSFLFPASELAVAALVLFVRGLVLRNAAYRKLIEEQRNLVILGTAASTLAHEIKNPLLAIRLQTSILSRICPESARRELAIIDEEVERLSSLSHRVNDYLRDPAGNPAVIDPREILREVGSRLCGRDILTGASAGDSSLRVRIDPERFRSLIENLVRNALESGGPEIEVAAETSIDDGELRIDVLDRGSGIADAARERAFDPFFTTKSRGTGIGLAICERFADAACGRISLSGRQGGGTRASLFLPLAAERGDGGGPI